MRATEIVELIKKILAHEFSGSEKEALIYALCEYQDKTFSLSVEEWAQAAGLSAPTASRAIRGLWEQKVLVREKPRRIEVVVDEATGTKFGQNVAPVYRISLSKLERMKK